MGIIRTGETEYDKELARWNTPKRLGGYAPDGYERFPLMLYKAFPDESGKVRCMMPPPEVGRYLSIGDFTRAESEAMAFTNRCQLTVRNEQEYDRARADGWRDTSGEALAYYEAIQREIAQAAAEENFRVRRMSDNAQREHQEATDATHQQVVDVRSTKKRGRPAIEPVTE